MVVLRGDEFDLSIGGRSSASVSQIGT